MYTQKHILPKTISFWHDRTWSTMVYYVFNPVTYALEFPVKKRRLMLMLPCDKNDGNLRDVISIEQAVGALLHDTNL